MSEETTTRLPFRRKHADIFSALAGIKMRLKGKFAYNHVWGHQDDSTAHAKLSVEARLNCKCDTMAKEALRSAFLNRKTSGTTLPLEGLTVHAGKEK